MVASSNHITVSTGEQLWQLAVSTLDDNWWHDHTVPSQTLYPHQWSWDTGFIAIGLARVAPQRAWHDLRTLFEAQWADGRVPHIVFDPRDGERMYFPGPEFWRSMQVAGAAPRATSGIVQPPVHALAAWEVYQAAVDPIARVRAIAELNWLYPRLVAQHEYLRRCRDLGGDGLACLLHPWESGQDNSPAWDAALAAVPADTAVLDTYHRVDLAVSSRSHRPTDIDYARYIMIAESYRDHGYLDDSPAGQYPFRVECPAFNAILAASEHALARIAAVVGADPAPHRRRADQVTRAMVDHLYQPATGTFHARDLATGRLSPVRYVGALVPLILPDLPSEAVAGILAEAASPRFALGDDRGLPLPSYDLTAPGHDPVRYWRGPIWINMNWLIWRGLREHGREDLAAPLRQSMIDLVRRSGCYEYFHTTTGEGVGTPEFSWTAALALDLLAAPGR